MFRSIIWRNDSEEDGLGQHAGTRDPVELGPSPSSLYTILVSNFKSCIRLNPVARKRRSEVEQNKLER